LFIITDGSIEIEYVVSLIKDQRLYSSKHINTKRTIHNYYADQSHE